MTKDPYQRQPGDLEIRVLKDGRFVLVAPDQELMDLGKILSQPLSETTENERNTDAAAHQENTTRDPQ